MLSTWAGEKTTWTTVDISTAFLTVKMPVEQLVLLRPPAVLVRLGLLKEDDIWIATRAVYGLRSAPRLWEQSRDEVLQTCDFAVDRGVKGSAWSSGYRDAEEVLSLQEFTFTIHV
eukprot:2419488-Amphidinium_carterae.1